MSLQGGCAIRLHIVLVYIPVLSILTCLSFMPRLGTRYHASCSCERRDARHASEASIADRRSEFPEIAAAIVHFRDDRMAERTERTKSS